MYKIYIYLTTRQVEFRDDLLDAVGLIHVGYLILNPVGGTIRVRVEVPEECGVVIVSGIEWVIQWGRDAVCGREGACVPFRLWEADVVDVAKEIVPHGESKNFDKLCVYGRHIL